MKILWILALGLVGCSGPAEIPDTPDLSGTIRKYEHPNAVFDQAAVEQALQDYGPLEQIAAGFRATGYATQGVDEADDASKKDADQTVRVQGSINVTIRCPGEFDDPVFDAATNGTLSLTIGVEESRVKRGIGGTATHCVLHGDDNGVPVRVEVDGKFAFDLGRDLAITDHWSGRLLMLISGTIHIGDRELKGLSARWTSDSLEYLFVLPDKTWAVAQLTSEGISVKDKDHVWVCPSGQPCAF